MSRKLDVVAKLMEDAFSKPSPEDKRLSEFILKQQDQQQKLEPANENDFRNLYNAFRSHSSKQLGKTRIGNDVDKPGSFQEQTRDAKEQWDIIQKPLDKILEENRSTFDAKLESVVSGLTSDIRQVERNILKNLNDGPHVYIHHPVRVYC